MSKVLKIKLSVHNCCKNSNSIDILNNCVKVNICYNSDVINNTNTKHK